jgi:hypothetical protein
MISACQGLRENGMNRWDTGDLERSKTIMYDCVMMDICHYKFVQNHGMYNIMNHNMNYEL